MTKKFLSPANPSFAICFWAIAYLLIIATRVSAQLPVVPPPQDITPPSPPTPPLTPQLLPHPDQLLKPPTSTTTDEIVPREAPKIRIEHFEIEGSTVFSQKQLESVTKNYTGREITFAELLQARSAITQLYIDKGYITSGALIPPQRLTNGVVKIQVVEGVLEKIDITGLKRLNPDYVRSRLALATRKPLNVRHLLTALQVLQLDPLIKNLSAELSAGTRPGVNVLDVKVTEANTFKSQIALDNSRSPSIGSFRRHAQLTQANLLGLGDGLTIGYSNTDGSNAVDVGYSLPVNARNGTVNFTYGNTWSHVIESPFNRLDIQANSRNYELSFRQRVIQTPQQELTLGITASRIESNSSLLKTPFALSPGANNRGETRISALQFSQEWLGRSSLQVIAARSQFTFGLDIDSTINKTAPDSRFFSWRGQGQWVRALAPDTLLLIRGDVQLADRALVPIEQFGLGGLASVRGYRQDYLLTDNGALLTTEIRLPIFRSRHSTTVQIIPFFDFGTAWNNRGTTTQNTLAAVGLGVQLLQGSNFSARLDWGIPLVSVPGTKRTWQENGLYFSIIANP